MHRYFRFLIAVTVIASALLNIIILSAGKAFGEEKQVAVSDAPKAQPANSIVSSLSPEAREIADLADITPVLEQLESLRNSPTTNELSLNSLARTQKIIYRRGQLNALIQAANLQISATRVKIESATAQAGELRAYITEKRNRITHRNSQVNLISGGLTKIVGYSIALAPITTIPTSILEVFDGGVQATLSALALREQRQETKLEHGMPPILVSFLNNTRDPHSLAPGVWMYMNHPPPRARIRESRREILIAGWEKSGMLHDTPKRSKSKSAESIELLDERLAMLTDLDSTISEMHSGLMELSNAVARSYSNSDNELLFSAP
jgi:hypothetical protein